MSTMHVEVVSNEKSIFSGEVTFIVVPTVTGELGIYPKHIPIMSLVKPGVLRMRQEGRADELLVAISGGLLEVQPNSVTILAEVAVRGNEMDEQRALAAKKLAEEKLKGAHDDKSTAQAQAALAAAIAELKTLDYIKARKR